MSHDADQGTVVEVKAVVTRLIPCPEHALMANGEMLYDGAGRPLQNPNGFRHDCKACKWTPTQQEEVD